MIYSLNIQSVSLEIPPQAYGIFFSLALSIGHETPVTASTSPWARRIHLGQAPRNNAWLFEKISILNFQSFSTFKKL
jgi:hypothetical protein